MSIKILGIRVDAVCMEEALSKVASFVAAGKEQLQQIVTINPEGIWLARNDAALGQIVAEAALVTPDGTGVLWAAQQQGQLLPERVTGVELMQQICSLAASRGWRVYLLGAAPGVAEAAAEKLQQTYPGLQIVGCAHGYFGPQDQTVAADIARADADILFAALGMPLQERWLYQHRQQLNCAVGMGVGGSFDVIAGNVKRAPRWLQKLRLEWLWRLLQDPRRWRRYLVIPKFMRAVKQEQAGKEKKPKK